MDALPHTGLTARHEKELCLDLMPTTSTKTIPLTRGLVAVVDADDYPTISSFKWYAQCTEPGRFYAARRKGRKIILLHREVMGAKKGQWTDHINSDTLDCRKENLRFVTPKQNAMNSRKALGASCAFKGVCRVSPRVNAENPFLAYIGSKSNRKYLGYFSSEILAARAYDRAAKNLFGKFAKLNFPIL